MKARALIEEEDPKGEMLGAFEGPRWIVREVNPTTYRVVDRFTGQIAGGDHVFDLRVAKLIAKDFNRLWPHGY